MQNELLAQAEKYEKKHKRRKLWQRIVSGLACVVVFCTTYALILPAITMERTTYCGLEEHQHSDTCYEKQLVCGFETDSNAQEELTLVHYQTNSDALEDSVQVHYHSEDCYEEVQELICSEEESSDLIDESVLEDMTEESSASGETFQIQIVEPHVHGPECYETRKILVCDLPEGIVTSEESEEFEETEVPEEAVEDLEEPVSDHIHTDDCYEYVLVCQMEEHEHTLACYSNPEADLESASVWERSISDVELTGVWAEDVIAIAESQLGYRESTENYIVMEDGETIKGITRYGQWYGDPYGDWCAMFISFCLHYAEIPTSAMPIEGNCARWVEKLDSRDLYAPSEVYSPYEGDLVFFDNDGDGRADHMGLVYERNFASDGYTMTGISTIEGNSSNKVKTSSYEIDDETILGYGTLPENQGYGIALAANVIEDGVGIDFSDMITGVTMQYRPNTWSDWKDITDDTVIEENGQLKFNIAYSVPGGTLDKDHKTITYELPDNITLVAEKSGKVTNSSGTEVGDYSISTDGTITITFYDNYANGNANGKEIEGHVYFEANVTDITRDEDGKIRLPFSDTVDLELKVTEQSKETGDLVVAKGVTSWNPDTGKVIYTLTVTSEDGTGSTITLTDTMTNAVYSGGLTVTDQNGNTVAGYDVPDAGVASFELSLPALEAGGSYTVTYEADFADPGSYTNIDINNKARVESTDQEGHPINDEASVDVYVDHIVLGKYGTAKSDGTVDWTITVNEGKQNIGGWTLSDTFNGQTLTADKINGTITLKNEATGATQTITLPYTFPEGTHDTYTITYNTPADKQVGSNGISNTATLTKPDGTPVGDQTGTVWTGSTYNPLTKTADSIRDNDDGTATIGWTVKIDAAEGDIPADWTYYDKLWSGQYFTGTQLKALDTALCQALSDAGLNLSYTIKAEKLKNADDVGDTVTWENIQDGEKYKTYTITFHTALNKGQSFTFSYETTAPVEGVTDSQYFRNDANINNKVWTNTGITYTPSRPTVEKVDARAGGESTTHTIGDSSIGDGVLKWEVKVTMPEGYSGGALTLIDTLPEGVTLTYLELRAEDTHGVSGNMANTEGTYDYYQHQVGVHQDGQQVTVIIPEDLANEGVEVFHLVVEVQINDDFTWTDLSSDGALHEGVFANSVELLDKDSKSLGTDVQTQTITKDHNKGVVAKSGYADENNIIHYSIVINPEGKVLLEGSDYLTLTDDLCYYDWYEECTVFLVPASVKIYRYDASAPDGKGEELPEATCPYTYDDSKNEFGTRHRVLTIQIPDETPLLIEYSYKFAGPVNWELSVSNSVTIDGVTLSDDGHHDQEKIKLTEGGATADIDGVTICKMDAENNGITLAGAEFNLYIWDEDGGTDGAGAYVPMTWDEGLKEYRPANDGETPATLVTRSDGTLDIELGYNVAYRLIETKAPEYYQGTEEPYDFLILSSDESHTYVGPGDAADNFVKTGGRKLSSGSLIYFPNTRTTTDISVIKRWVKEDGTDVTDQQTGSISFELWRREVPPEETGGGSASGPGMVTVDKYDATSGDKKGTLLQTSDYNIGDTVHFHLYYVWQAYNHQQEKITVDGETKAAIVETFDWGSFDSSQQSAKIAHYYFDVTVTVDKLVRLDLYDAQSDGWKLEVMSVDSATPAPGPEEPTGPADIKIGTYSISAADNWAYTVTNLPKEAPNGNRYVYYIVEVGGDGYGVTYLNNGGITYGAITMTNTAPDTPPSTYILPETGGAGTFPYTIGSILLTSAALLLLYKTKSRRKEDNASS